MDMKASFFSHMFGLIFDKRNIFYIPKNTFDISNMNLYEIIMLLVNNLLLMSQVLSVIGNY